MRSIPANASDIDFVGAGGRPGLRIKADHRIVQDLDSWSLGENIPGLLRSHVIGKFDVYCLAVSDENWDPDTGGGNQNVTSMDNLLGLFHHFPFFSGVAIVQEDIDFRQNIEGNLVRVNMWNGGLSFEYLTGLCRQLIHRRRTGAGHRLVGGGDDGLSSG